MKFDNIDFGYACVSTEIKNCSTAKTVPKGRFEEMDDKEVQIYRLRKVAEANLTNTIRLLWHNIAEGFILYRFSSQLIPLANHPSGQIWDYTEVLADKFEKISKIISKNKLKVSSHPGQYTVINTKDEDKFKNAVRDLKYHNKVLSAMGLDENTVMVTHVGGVYGDKEASLERFIDNFRKLPEEVKNRIVIENDDTSYSISEVLALCQELDRPMVLDVHHHQCYNQGEDLEEMLPDIFTTWDKLERPPKVHFSSPRSKKNPKRHADYIDPDQFLEFAELAKDYEFDIMVEAKKKDGAVLKLWKDIGFEPPKNY